MCTKNIHKYRLVIHLDMYANVIAVHTHREMEKEGKGYVLEEDDDEGVLLEDSGVLGILDKLVAMNSALFVSGAKRCGRVR